MRMRRNMLILDTVDARFAARSVELGPRNGLDTQFALLRPTLPSELGVSTKTPNPARRYRIRPTHGRLPGSSWSSLCWSPSCCLVQSLLKYLMAVPKHCPQPSSMPSLPCQTASSANLASCSDLQRLLPWVFEKKRKKLPARRQPCFSQQAWH